MHRNKVSLKIIHYIPIRATTPNLTVPPIILITLIPRINFNPTCNTNNNNRTINNTLKAVTFSSSFWGNLPWLDSSKISITKE